jgi:trk system potassium uptake protein TrkA
MCIQLPDDFEIVEVKAPAEVCGRSLEDIGLREKYKLNLVTILRKEEGSTEENSIKDYHIIGVPDSETVIEKTDIIVLFGLTKNIERFLEINK